MPTLRDVLSVDGHVSGPDAEWLHRLVGDWQMVADLSFADLTLWLRTQTRSWVLAAHARPSTGPNFYHDDVVGQPATRSRAEVLDLACRTKRAVTPPGVGHVRENFVPVVHGGRVAGVLVRHTDLDNMRQQGGLEVNYLQIAQALLGMVGEGRFPTAQGYAGVGRGTPRVGDGVIRLSAEGRIDYASPNAVSALRRLGHTEVVAGEDLSRIVLAQLPAGSMVDETMPLVLTGRAPWGTEIETHRSNLTLRCIPLIAGATRHGALLLLRDVSELRRRERELLTKEATIREIHHRVKNNLQTVSALLRLQSRRLEDPTARAALQEAGRRLSTVALVHDALSHGFDETVPFDDLAPRILRAILDVASRGPAVELVSLGSFGLLRAEDATPLAMILAELVHNAVEHGFADSIRAEQAEPRVTIEAARSVDEHGGVLAVTVSDNGQGLPWGHSRPPGSGLGMQIVEALLADLKGDIDWQTMEPHGTSARFVVRLRSPLEAKQSLG